MLKWLINPTYVRQRAEVASLCVLPLHLAADTYPLSPLKRVAFGL
jgi:hypothetical protein